VISSEWKSGVIKLFMCLFNSSGVYSFPLSDDMFSFVSQYVQFILHPENLMNIWRLPISMPSPCMLENISVIFGLMFIHLG